MGRAGSGTWLLLLAGTMMSDGAQSIIDIGNNISDNISANISGNISGNIGGNDVITPNLIRQTAINLNTI
jgi:hypothetical protein